MRRWRTARVSARQRHIIELGDEDQVLLGTRAVVQSRRLGQDADDPTNRLVFDFELVPGKACQRGVGTQAAVKRAATWWSVACGSR